MISSQQALERLTAANPVPDSSPSFPAAGLSPAVLLERIEERNRFMTETPTPIRPTRPRRGWKVAAAAFVAVLAIGAAIAFLAPAGDDVVEPSTTTTTVTPSTTTPSTTTPPDTTSAPTTATPTTTPAPVQPLSSSPGFAFFNSANPVTEPGAVVFDSGLWHMFYRSVSWQDIAGEGDGFNAAVGYATSENGRSWDDAGIVTTVADTGLDYPDANGMSVGSAIVGGDGTWSIYFHTYQPSGGLFSGGVIGRMTAPGPTGPWTVDADPVLSPGSEGAWDSDAVAYPSVLQVGDELWMYYDGNAGDLESTGDRSIGLATSADGMTWTKYDDPGTDSGPFAASDPVLTTTRDTWDQPRVLNASVVNTAEGFVMAYLTNEVTDVKVGLAFSDDGIAWTKSEANPVYDGAARGFTYAGVASFINNGEGYVLIADLSDNNPGDGSSTQVFTWFHEGSIRE